MESEKALSEIKERLEKKYVSLVEIMRLTDELNEALSMNDRRSIRLVMTMRGGEMEKMGVLDGEIESLMDFVSDKERDTINNYKTKEECSKSVERICQIKQRTQRLLDKVIEKDKAMSKRVYGDSSFYSDK